MNVAELIQLLNTVEDKKREVVMSKDGEGNSYSPLFELGLCAYKAETTWYGEAGPEYITAVMEKQGFTEEDVVDGKPAVCLWPTN